MERISNNWWYNAILYQIYPRSFKDSDRDGIGDLKGIIEKLDYLSRVLKIDGIWLSPIYTSPQKDFGYDISDFYDIDPLFGNLETFDELVEKAHKRGIKIIMDYVPNHTSDKHPWFRQSKSNKTNPKRDWYVWRDGKTPELPPNNWLSSFGGSAWEFDETTGEYYLHSFLREQPDLNWRNEEVKKEMSKILDYWLRRGVDGFRTDAIMRILEDKEFKDDPENPDYIEGKNPPYESLLHTNSRNEGEIRELFEETICKNISKNPEIFMISEANLKVKDLVTLYGSCKYKNHIPFNFNLIRASWDASEYKRIVDDFEEVLGEGDMPNYVLGNHDRPRIATRLGIEKARLAGLMQLTLRGMAVIYYGEELGMEDIQISQDEVLDPWERLVPGFGLGRDPERTPMQWDATKNSGFSIGNSWLPVNDNYEKINVASEKYDETSTLNLYRTLIGLRKKSQALKYGRYKRLLLFGNNEVFAYMRVCEDEKIFIAVNFSDSVKKVDLRNFHHYPYI